ncbi:hypothetical protein ACQ4M4_19970 [Leptolyngbya sp. AN02str]|uniref:hypothetical protein n=1 Tax=Leptolyngbya sp. AN02str TaxID=3423363 RepID=UPI003D31BA9E
MKMPLVALLVAPGLLSCVPFPSSVETPSIYAQATPSAQSFVGTRYLSGDLPEGVEELGGWLVGELLDRNDYWINQVRQGEQEFLWFNIRPGDQGQQAIFEVVDVLEMPAIAENENLVSSCELNEQPDPELLAIAQYTETEYLTQIRQAWRANRTSGQIEPISPAEIRCYNPAWGV